MSFWEEDGEQPVVPGVEMTINFNPSSCCIGDHVQIIFDGVSVNAIITGLSPGYLGELPKMISIKIRAVERENG